MGQILLLLAKLKLKGRVTIHIGVNEIFTPNGQFIGYISFKMKGYSGVTTFEEHEETYLGVQIGQVQGEDPERTHLNPNGYGAKIIDISAAQERSNQKDYFATWVASLLRGLN